MKILQTTTTTHQLFINPYFYYILNVFNYMNLICAWDAYPSIRELQATKTSSRRSVDAFV